MGKHILTTWDSLGRPITTETWDHTYQAFYEPLAGIIIGMIESKFGVGSYDNTKVYIISGCQSDPFHNIASGYVFYNGEIYQSDAAILGSTSNVVAIMEPTFYSGVHPDPIVFADLSTHSVHQTLKCKFVLGSTGTGTFNGGPSVNNDYNNFLVLQSFPSTVEARTTFNGDTVTFEISRSINYANPITGTLILDTTGAVVGSKVIFYGTIPNTTVLSFSGTGFIVFNVGANVATANRRYFKLEVVGIDTINAWGA